MRGSVKCCSGEAVQRQYGCRLARGESKYLWWEWVKRRQDSTSDPGHPTQGSGRVSGVLLARAPKSHCLTRAVQFSASVLCAVRFSANSTILNRSFLSFVFRFFLYVQSAFTATTSRWCKLQPANPRWPILLVQGAVIYNVINLNRIERESNTEYKAVQPYGSRHCSTAIYPSSFLAMRQ